MAARSAYIAAAREALWARSSFTFIPDRDLPPPSDRASPGTGPRLVFAGFPSDYSLGFLYALLDLDAQLAGIVTSPGAHPAILGENALSRVASHLGVPLIRAWRINDEHSLLALSETRADAVVMASFDQIVGPRALQVPRHGWLNVHPSLLPKYRGPEPVYWAIAEGAARTGITLHRAVPRVDTGPILAQAELAISPDDTSGTLTRRLVEAGVSLLPGAVEALLADAPGRAPDLSAATYRSSVGHRPLESAATAVDAERMVRAGVPNMLAWATLDGRPAYVRAARIVSNTTAAGGPLLHYPDADLELVETAELCGCHHNASECPHRLTGSDASRRISVVTAANSDAEL
jgi:methionyl-tRNA formyltransferase